MLRIIIKATKYDAFAIIWLRFALISGVTEAAVKRLIFLSPGSEKLIFPQLIVNGCSDGLCQVALKNKYDKLIIFIAPFSLLSFVQNAMFNTQPTLNF